MTRERTHITYSQAAFLIIGLIVTMHGVWNLGTWIGHSLSGSETYPPTTSFIIERASANER